MGMGFQTRGGVPDMGMGFQTWRSGSRHGDGVSDMGMGFQSGMGFQTWRWVPEMGMGFQTRKNPNFLYRWRGPLVMIFDRVGLGKGHGDGFPDMEMGFQA